MRKTLVFSCLLPFLLPAGAFAADGGIQVDHAWARPTIGSSTTSAAYFTITDSGAPDRLVSVATPVAGHADVHESVDDHGVMKMRGVSGIALETGKPVRFAPGGYHVMLMELKQPLKPGDSFPITLRFEHAAEVTVNVTVQQTAGQGHGQGMQGQAHGQGMQMGHDMSNMSHGSGSAR